MASVSVSQNSLHSDNRLLHTLTSCAMGIQGTDYADGTANVLNNVNVFFL